MSRARMAHWAIVASGAAAISGCSPDWAGSFGGQWKIGGGVIVAAPGGNKLYKNSGKGVVSESEVTISKQGGGQFQVKLDTPFMACTLRAAGADKELAIDGPTASEAYKPDDAKRWQHCTFTFEGFRGQANVRGTVRSKPGGVITIVMQILPYSTPPSVKIVEGSSAIAHFEGSRGRQVHR